MNKPCRSCGRPGPAAICPGCQRAASLARGPRQARGYDATYDRNRAAMVARSWERGELCVICGQGFTRRADITAEHLVPVRRGGGSDPGNLAPAHKSCNSSWRARSGP